MNELSGKFRNLLRRLPRLHFHKRGNLAPAFHIAIESGWQPSGTVFRIWVLVKVEEANLLRGREGLRELAPVAEHLAALTDSIIRKNVAMLKSVCLNQGVEPSQLRLVVDPEAVPTGRQAESKKEADG